MMICKNCKKALLQHARFCTNCGEPVTMNDTSEIEKNHSSEVSGESDERSESEGDAEAAEALSESDGMEPKLSETHLVGDDDLSPEVEIQISEPEIEDSDSGAIAQGGLPTEGDGIEEAEITLYEENTELTQLLQKKLLEARNSLSLGEKKIDCVDDLLHRIQDWESRNLITVTSSVLEKMASNVQEAEETLEHFEKELDALEIPDPGTMNALRKSFLKDLSWTWPPVSVLTGVLLYMPHAFSPSIRAFAATIYGFLGVSVVGLLIYWLTIMFLTTTLHLMNYYRGWSRFERAVSMTSWKLRVIASKADEVRGEVRRLTDVAPQLRDWLEIISRSLRHPWSVADEWMATSGLSIQRDSLPYSLRLAQAVENEGPELIAMERFAAEHYMVRGWRAKVLEDQISAVREQLGFAINKFNVEQLDNDLTYSPNGPRKLVLQNLSDERILRKVGVRQLLPLMHDVQMEVVDKVRPPVIESRDNLFENIVRAEIDSDQGSTQPWDEFLAYSLQDGSRPRTPLSKNGFSDTGLASGNHDHARTFVVAPERFADKYVANDQVQFRGYSPDSKLSMEIAVRHDFVGPLNKSDLEIFSKKRVGGLGGQQQVVRPVIESNDDGV
jgi:hypothetical protein